MRSFPEDDDPRWIASLRDDSDKKTAIKMDRLLRRMDQPLAMEWWMWLCGLGYLGLAVIAFSLRSTLLIQLFLLVAGYVMLIIIYWYQHTDIRPWQREAAAARCLQQLVSDHPDVYERFKYRQPRIFVIEEQIELTAKRYHPLFNIFYPEP